VYAEQINKDIEISSVSRPVILLFVSHREGLSVHAKSSMTPLPFDAYEVKRLLKRHHSCMRRGFPLNPTSAILPVRELVRNNGLSKIAECLQRPSPASYTVQFEVAHTIPVCNPRSNEAIKQLCRKKKDGTSSFQFALHVKDLSAEIDIICRGKVADDILGVTAQDITERPDKCNEAMNALKELMSPGSICEGKIQSIVAKDGKIYFVLKSMFCIAVDTA
jgi:hypothetical protein